nr:hypothetical protein LSAT_6X56501 [Tanacetum cinerariifolium]
MKLDTLDSTGADVVKVVIDVAYICNVAPVFHVLAHTKMRKNSIHNKFSLNSVAFSSFPTFNLQLKPLKNDGYEKEAVKKHMVAKDDWSGGCMTVSGTEEICIDGERLRIIFFPDFLGLNGLSLLAFLWEGRVFDLMLINSLGHLTEIFVSTLYSRMLQYGDALILNVDGLVIELQVNYNNIHKVLWEPFLKPWKLQVSLRIEHGKSALQNSPIMTDVHLELAMNLNINVTESLIEAFCSSYPMYIDDTTPKEQIFNFKTSHSSDNLGDRKLADAQHHYITIQREGTSTLSTPVSIDLVGVRSFEVDFSNSANNIGVDNGGICQKILDPVYPGHEFLIPLHLAEIERIRWHPLGSTYLCNEAYNISNILSNEIKFGYLHSFVCYPSLTSSDPFRCCVSVHDMCLPSIGKINKGSSHYIHDTLMELVKDDDVPTSRRS